jgi:hypothetical protein
MNQLIAQLLRNYGEINTQNQDVGSPFFTARLWANIRQEQQYQQLWEVRVVSAKKWLFGLSFVALLFFFSNLLVITFQTDFSDNSQQQLPFQYGEESDYWEEFVIGRRE